MKKEERELRELLPRSALLHNCLVLAIAKVVHTGIKTKLRTWHMMFCVYLVLCFSIHSFLFLLQNCPVLVVSKEVSHISFCFHCQPQDGVDREFWKFGCSLLVCHDKGQLNRDKLLVFDRSPNSEEGEENVLRKELQRY